MSDSRLDMVLFEETLNRLIWVDGRIRAGREAALNWIRQRLSEELRARLALSPALWDGFEAGEEPGFSTVADALLESCQLSDTQAAQYRAMLECNRGEAAAWLWKTVIENELRRLPERSSGKHLISPVSWWRFRCMKVYPSPALADKVVAALGLGTDKADELRSLLLRGNFSDVGPLKTPVRDSIRSSGKSVTAFREDAYISRSAWLPFEPHGKGVVSQGTLLKLVLALDLTPDGGWDFLSLIHDGFYMDCDLLFLAYMQLICAVSGRDGYVPEQLAQIIEQRRFNEKGKSIFDNPYPPDALLDVD
jgi:hypothetical protein